jgi:hypothetical protein
MNKRNGFLVPKLLDNPLQVNRTDFDAGDVGPEAVARNTEHASLLCPVSFVNLCSRQECHKAGNRLRQN